MAAHESTAISAAARPYGSCVIMENFMDYPGIVVYGHYDVQPVDPLSEWKYDPFDMRMGDMKGFGRVYLGRGVSDDKGGTWSVISTLAVLNTILKGGLARLPINIILVIEGEEEIGSPGFRSFLEANKEMFNTAKMVVSVDGGQPHRDKGSLTLSFRGMMAGQIDVKGADIDLHSGKVRADSYSSSSSSFFQSINDVDMKKRGAGGDDDDGGGRGVRATRFHFNAIAGDKQN